MLPLVDQFYYVSAAVGFLFVVGSFVIGQFGDNSAGADGQSADGGDFGNVDSGGTGGGDFGNVDSGGTGGGDCGNVDSGSTGGHRGGLSAAGSRIVIARTQAPVQAVGPVLLILKFLSPSTIATFLFCFGVFGILLSRYMSFLGNFSLLPATVLGVLGYKGISAMLSALMHRLHSSKNFSDEQLIGKSAEVTVPISKGKIGEITYVGFSSRQTSSARALKPDQSFAKTDKVIISDLKDGIFLVEPWIYDVDGNEIVQDNQALTTNKRSLPKS